MPELLIATKNADKMKELKKLLSKSNFILSDLNEFPNIGEVSETGRTFTENAVLKARNYALQTKMRAVADDSGLEVETLDGAPGVFSARYAGEFASDAEKINKLLRELHENKQRRARFVCVMAVADEKGTVEFLAEGVCNGKIAVKASGTNGFGYDPIFVPDGFEQTFGELSSEIKQKISHRARAAAKIIRFLDEFTA